jgi:DNA repair protein SbcD/Mre11
MRFLQTGDWHLGHTLHDVPREREHARFLAWLLETVVAERCDALLMCGDVFETANPPATALLAWYDFLAALHRRMPALHVDVIGGNHDSAARLEATRPLLDPMQVHVVGALPRSDDGALDLERLVVPLPGADGATAAWVAAVPFLRPADLPVLPVSHGEPVLDPLILGGNQHALPVDIFPDDVDYVALGHLHKAQRVAGREHVRYSGSPVPLAMAELDYRHTVIVVDVDGGGAPAVRPPIVRSIDVPRTRELRRVPRHGAAPIDEVLAALRALPDAPAGMSDEPDSEAPLIEVCVALEKPEPRLRRRVEEALAGKPHRLVKLWSETCGDGASLADAAGAAGAASLADLEPVEVFQRRYRRDHDGDPPAALLAAFHEVLESVQQDRGRA